MTGPMPRISSAHFHAMSDGTGLFQHAILDVPDRAHGYCIDDNARALLASYDLGDGSREEDSRLMATTFASFIQHGWNRDTGRFRNFMAFDRRWLEAQGSEDSHGRTLWALGVCGRDDPCPVRRAWALRLMRDGTPVLSTFRSPRAWAFALLGLCAADEAVPGDTTVIRMCDRLAGQLMDLLKREERADWIWFEDVLAYDNARLPQALIAVGRARKRQDHINAGVRTLNWLIEVQTGEHGLFRPVGSHSFGAPHVHPEPFDQQPLEVAATVAACRIAYEITENPFFLAEASRAYRWLLGDNDLGIALLDPDTGRCCDGLHPDRANANCGGESLVSALLAAADMRALERTARLSIVVSH
ncbi:hypothetical protein L1787_11995 [Acuticoccus sp. M5D2P5]|uniref:hypothetical protein n=1 Tax=Acuticoccus kalidii TaxID=2910977 RepID=UPI001F43D456|nr:hypothetical protein [Acuticoccus kalidii]MCF3934135.1 hypothetical protein [Acuticoccus kalidii]